MANNPVGPPSATAAVPPENNPGLTQTQAGEAMWVPPPLGNIPTPASDVPTVVDSVLADAEAEYALWASAAEYRTVGLRD